MRRICPSLHLCSRQSDSQEIAQGADERDTGDVLNTNKFRPLPTIHNIVVHWNQEYMVEYQPYQASAQVQARYASVGPRFLALLIDGLVISVFIGILEGIGVATGSSSTAALLGGLGGLIGFLYIVAMEATKGATLGKMALGLRVVKDDGSPAIGWGASLIRNLLRVIDGLFAYLVGAIIIWNNPRRKRLGDMAAHTVVVKTR